jgi:lia operon protein LiaG
MARPVRLSVLIPALPFLFLGLGHHPLPAGAATVAGDRAAGSFSVTDSRVHVYDLVGHVELVAGTGPAVRLDATFGGRDGSRLGFANLAKDGTAFIVKFPSDHIHWSDRGGHSSTSIDVNADGTFDERENGWDHGVRHVRIDDREGGLDAWADLHVSVPRGQQIIVHVGMGHVAVTNLDGNLVVLASAADVDVQGAAGSLKVATGSGDVTANGVKGMVAIDTGSGSVHGRDLDGEDVKIETGSGDVTASAIRAPKLKAQTGSGEVEIDGVRSREIVLGTGSGNVTLQLLANVERLKIETGSGDVKVRAPASLDAAVRVGTGSGGIDSDFALKNVRRGDGELSGTIGEGRGSILVSTGSGSVHITQD